jgi:hypothetical protein
LRAMTRLSRCALPIVLMLALTPTAAFAQSLVCAAIRRGDTASHLAHRLTGDGRNSYQPWFQIMAPSGRFVPKSQYDRLHPGWRACLVRRAIDRRPPNGNRVEAVAAAEATEAIEVPDAPEALAAYAAVDTAGDGPQPMASDVGTIGRVDLTVLWLGAAVAVPWFGWRILDEYLARRRTASIIMRHFADRFVREFERPLIQQDAAEHPVRVRLRHRRFGRRFDILLAPGTGRRYPNLSDHKRNVEYDVVRVLQVLADDSLVNGPLRAHAEWIVVPFQFKVDPKPTGVTCISSF